MNVKGTIKVPRCWKRLIETLFQDGAEGLVEVKSGRTVTSELHLKGNDDPDAHYDDSRCVLGRTKCGGTIDLDLCSGQSNYYGGITIHDSEGEVVHGGDIGDPLESFEDVQEFVGEDDNIYVITIDWQGTDPYETFQRPMLDDRAGSPDNSFHCANCDGLFDKGNVYPQDTFCCSHCYNRHQGDECAGECQDCKDDEVTT